MIFMNGMRPSEGNRMDSGNAIEWKQSDGKHEITNKMCLPFGYLEREHLCTAKVCRELAEKSFVMHTVLN